MRTDKPFIIGLTGSMGMGKSTTAKMFRDQGIPVWDADAVVHKMYAAGGAAVGPIQNIYPEAIIDGAVDRSALKSWISKDETALLQIEALVHPLLSADRTAFLAGLETDIAVLDFPLLFETGAEKNVDMVVVVSVPAPNQKQRILARKTMDKALLETILASQMPDIEKRAKADRVIETISLEATQKAVQTLLTQIRKDQLDA